MSPPTRRSEASMHITASTPHLRLLRCCFLVSFTVCSVPAGAKSGGCIPGYGAFLDDCPPNQHGIHGPPSSVPPTTTGVATSTLTLATTVTVASSTPASTSTVTVASSTSAPVTNATTTAKQRPQSYDFKNKPPAFWIYLSLLVLLILSLWGYAICVIIVKARTLFDLQLLLGSTADYGSMKPGPMVTSFSFTFIVMSKWTALTLSTLVSYIFGSKKHKNGAPAWCSLIAIPFIISNRFLDMRLMSKIKAVDPLPWCGAAGLLLTSLWSIMETYDDVSDGCVLGGLMAADSLLHRSFVRSFEVSKFEGIRNMASLADLFHLWGASLVVMVTSALLQTAYATDKRASLAAEEASLHCSAVQFDNYKGRMRANRTDFPKIQRGAEVMIKPDFMKSKLTKTLSAETQVRATVLSITRDEDGVLISAEVEIAAHDSPIGRALKTIVTDQADIHLDVERMHQDDENRAYVFNCLARVSCETMPQLSIAVESLMYKHVGSLFDDVTTFLSICSSLVSILATCVFLVMVLRACCSRIVKDWVVICLVSILVPFLLSMVVWNATKLYFMETCPGNAWTVTSGCVSFQVTI